MIPHRTITVAFWVTGLALALSAGLFTVLPETDLQVSGLFSDGSGFALNESVAFQTFRYIAWVVSVLFLVAFLLLWAIMGIRRPPTQRIATRVWAFAVLLYAAAPGLLANVLLKQNWGRARPRSVIDFGGKADFTPALEIADQCTSNCSFVSGEASGIVATALVITLLFVPALGDRARTSVLFVTWFLAIVVALLRVAMGGHFLSDVVFAALFTVVIALGLFRTLRLDREPPSVTLTNIGRDLRDALTFGRASRKP